MTHAGDLIVSGTDDLIEFLDAQMEEGSDVNVSDRSGAICLGAANNNKAAYEFIQGGGIFDNTNNFTGIQARSRNYEEKRPKNANEDNLPRKKNMGLYGGDSFRSAFVVFSKCDKN